MEVGLIMMIVKSRVVDRFDYNVCVLRIDRRRIHKLAPIILGGYYTFSFSLQASRRYAVRSH